ncbi:hypothetical protein DQ238_18825 [Geodermatophilus sp. TF02-6]|uniref:hypothetical protein n=1 Tax=Geodermatophilus sp. TF02-6 TaxID=2250575 RepID=UPI000DE9F454|nr:hypothetical protein [Geodermatophilus sp. TF02-6]RBY75802.1 hypothetical protein DQ238_18825 [Geodermatophilus sp. TF02-6]
MRDPGAPLAGACPRGADEDGPGWLARTAMATRSADRASRRYGRPGPHRTQPAQRQFLGGAGSTEHAAFWRYVERGGRLDGVADDAA